NRFDTFPRNADGGFWHKDTQPNEMLLDGIYMLTPFLARYGAVFSCGSYCPDTIREQDGLLYFHVHDAQTHLVYHAWDQDRNASWANPTTGVSSQVWSRGLGWFAMSLVDALVDLPTPDPAHAELLAMLQEIAQGARNTQDAATGLWFQVVDQGA